MNNKTVDELVRIAMAGGGFEVDARRRTTDDLVRIAMAGGDKTSRLRVINASTKTTDELVRIALAGKGRIFFAP